MVNLTLELLILVLEEFLAGFQTPNQLALGGTDRGQYKLAQQQGYIDENRDG